MAIEKVRQYLSQYEMDDKILEFDVSSATVELAAKALNCEPERIAKTLSFKIDGKCILIVAAGDAKIANPKYKSEFATKAKMLSPDETAQMIGYEVGGVCPFGVNDDVDIYLDESLRRFTTVFPACGSSNSAIELTISQLEEYSNYKDWIDVCKGWEEE